MTTVDTVQDVASLQMFDFFYIIHRHRFFTQAIRSARKESPAKTPAITVFLKNA